MIYICDVGCLSMDETCVGFTGWWRDSLKQEHAGQHKTKEA